MPTSLSLKAGRQGKGGRSQGGRSHTKGRRLRRLPLGVLGVNKVPRADLIRLLKNVDLENINGFKFKNLVVCSNGLDGILKWVLCLNKLSDLLWVNSKKNINSD
jgi:hypothetical protein